jgi:hypothetical protein
MAGTSTSELLLRNLRQREILTQRLLLEQQQQQQQSEQQQEAQACSLGTGQQQV